MFKKVMVPLDGSELAEQALAPACRIAEKFGGELLLVRVVTAEHSLPTLAYRAARPDGSATQLPRADVDEAEAYLTNLKVPAMGVPVRTLVLSGAPPELIIATAAESGVDLIVMSTHGRAGLMRLLYGSVAEAVLRGASVPVLLMPSRVLDRQRARRHDSQWGDPLPVQQPAPNRP